MKLLCSLGVVAAIATAPSLAFDLYERTFARNQDATPSVAPTRDQLSPNSLPIALRGTDRDRALQGRG